MALQASGQMSFADVYNEITGESLQNPPISITIAELGQLQNISGQTIALNQFSPYRPDGILPTVFPDEWYRYCQTCGLPKPFLQITKQAATSANAGEFFNYFITITNNGETSTVGDIYIYDTIPNNIIISSVTGSDMTYTVTNQNVLITYTGALQIGQSASFYIIIKTFNSGTYYNQASVNGGGDLTIRYSNTTATTVTTATYTATVTERRDRTLQRNDCGEFGTGSFVQVWSPFFTTTITSFISQQDAETQARNESVRLANNWLDANAQAVANSEGTCGFVYPNLQLVQSISPSTINRFQNTTLNINIRNFTTFTSGTITLTCNLPGGLYYTGLQNAPAGWSFSVNQATNTITMTTDQQLSPSYNADFRFTVTGIGIGTYSFFTFGTGGNIQNPPVNSNSTSITINQEPVYSLTTSVYNFDFDPPGYAVRAAPGDNAYYIATLTINNGNSGNDELSINAFIPSWISAFSQLQIDYNTTYFNFNVQSGDQVRFSSKTNYIPAGQYSFRVMFKIPLDFYYAFDVPKTLNDNLVINSNNASVPRNQVVSFYFNKNSQFISQSNASIFWVNNYRFEVFWTPDRNPFNDVGKPITKTTQEGQRGNVPFPTPYVVRDTVPFTPIFNSPIQVTTYYRNIIKDWPENPMNDFRYENGIINTGFTVYFDIDRGIGGAYPGIFTILTNPNKFASFSDYGVPFVVDINTKAYSRNMYLLVDFNGYYIA